MGRVGLVLVFAALLGCDGQSSGPPDVSPATQDTGDQLSYVVDDFEVRERPQVDILLALDLRLISSFYDFPVQMAELLDDVFADDEVQARVAVVSMSGWDTASSQHVLGPRPRRVIPLHHGDAKQAIQTRLLSAREGQVNHDNRGIDLIHKVLMDRPEGFPAVGADVHVVLVSERDDSSAIRIDDAVPDLLGAYPGEPSLRISAALRPPPGSALIGRLNCGDSAGGTAAYHEFLERMSGEWFPTASCEVLSELEDIAEDIHRRDHRFYLGSKPVVSTLKVRVVLEEAGDATVFELYLNHHDAKHGFQYEPDTNSVVFNALNPPYGSRVEVSYAVQP